MTQYRILKVTFKYKPIEYQIESRITLFGIPFTFWESDGLPSFEKLEDARREIKLYNDKATYEVIE